MHSPALVEPSFIGLVDLSPGMFAYARAVRVACTFLDELTPYLKTKKASSSYAEGAQDSRLRVSMCVCVCLCARASVRVRAAAMIQCPCQL